MNCPGCNHSDWEYPDETIARCRNCGYLVNPYTFGMKSSSSTGNARRSENSKRLAIVALLVSFFLYLIAIWMPDWQGLWMIGAGVSLFLFIDHILYL